jgi:hypothetical protein
VASTYPSETYEFVNGKDDIPYINYPFGGTLIDGNLHISNGTARLVPIEREAKKAVMFFPCRGRGQKW